MSAWQRSFPPENQSQPLFTEKDFPPLQQNAEASGSSAITSLPQPRCNLDTYSPVVRTATIRLVLHTVTVMQWAIRQFDVQHAFLHGDLSETVYMRQPAGFVDKDHPDHVCLLRKAIYGLKQAPRAWFDKFSMFLLEFGFTCSFSDPSMFIWLCLVLKDLGIPLPSTPLMLCDNLSAVMLAANPSFHSKTKHFTRDHHYIRERVALKAVEVKHISNKLQVADIFTKSLALEPFRRLRGKLGVCLPPTQSLRGPINDRPKPTPKPHQVWRPKNEFNQNDAAASASATSRTCKEDKEDIKALNAKCLKAASVKAIRSSQTAHVIATANRFQALCDELAETS